MNTLMSLAIMLACLTIGRIFLFFPSLLMSWIGIFGSIICNIKKKYFFKTGFLISLLGQLYIQGAYMFIWISGLEASKWDPHFPKWPLWIAAFYHGMAPPFWVMKNVEETLKVEPESHEFIAIQSAEGFIIILSFILFFIMAFFHSSFQPMYGWAPFFWTSFFENLFSKLIN